MTLKFYSISFAAVALALLVSFPSPQSKNPAAAPNGALKQYPVVGFTGHWSIAKENDVAFNTKIADKMCVAGTQKDSSLVVMINDTAVPFDCKRSDDICGLPRPIGSQPSLCLRQITSPNQSLVTMWSQAIQRAFFDDSREGYITPVSRGLEPTLVDAVLALDVGQVDVAPVFQDIREGAYSIRFEYINGATTTYPAKLSWTGRGPAIISIPQIKAGLYRLARLDADGDPAEPGAWVLLDPPTRFAKDAASFQSAVEATKKWPDAVDSRAPRASLRAYLQLLSEDGSAPK